MFKSTLKQVKQSSDNVTVNKTNKHVLCLLSRSHGHFLPNPN